MITGSEIQVEDGGFARIHNAILEALSMTTLSSVELRLVIFLVRKTYGYNKKDDIVSISQFQQATGTSRQAVVTALQNLERLSIITRRHEGSQSYRYGLNKYLETWSSDAFASRHAGNASRFHKTGTSQATETSEAKETSQATETGTSQVAETSTSQAGETGTSQAGETHKRQLKTLLKTKKEKRATKRSPDPLLEHPAVVIYRDLCHLTPNAVQRQAIASSVDNADLWTSVLNRWMLSGWKPGNVSGQLERYTAEVGTNGTGHKDVQVVQGENGEWVAVEVQR